MAEKQLSGLQVESIDRALRRHARVKKLSRLTTARAHALLAREPRETLVVASTADAAALALLRAEGSRTTSQRRARRTWLREEPDSHRRPQSAGPFARRASRIPRYLLLHPTEAFSVSELTKAADVDKSVTSRVLAELARDALVRVETDPVDARARVASLADPRRLLEEWSCVWRRARPASQRFNIGVSTVAETLRAIGDARVQAPWAISGVAGAAVVRRAVEPADETRTAPQPMELLEWKKNLFRGARSGSWPAPGSCRRRRVHFSLRAAARKARGCGSRAVVARHRERR